MAENLTIARPYAQAVFEIAKEDKSFDKWSTELEALSCAVSNSEFFALLNAASSRSAAAKMLVELLGDLLDEKGKNFVYVLGENDRFAVLPEIYQDFARMRDDFLHVKAVEVVCARKLSAADEKAIVAKLEQKYQAKISLTQTVDPSIMGGIIIRVGDEVIDGSVKTNLARLSSTLK